MTTALYTNANVDGSKAVLAEKENRLVDLEAQDFWLDEVDGRAVDLDEALALFAKGDGGGVLLAAKALNGLHGVGVSGCEWVFVRGGGRRW